MLNQVVEDLNKNVVGCEAILNQAEAGDSSISVKADNIVKVCEQLRDGDQKFHSLQLISAVDYTEELEIVYVLCNFDSGAELLLKTRLPRPEGAMSTVEIDSVYSVWDSANFQERECYDMMGILFKNHPDMRRILCPEDWEGFPLRKDYVAQEQWHGMTVYPEAKNNKADREFSALLKEEEKRKLAQEKAKLAEAQAVAKKDESDDNSGKEQ